MHLLLWLISLMLVRCSGLRIVIHSEGIGRCQRIQPLDPLVVVQLHDRATGLVQRLQSHVEERVPRRIVRQLDLERTSRQKDRGAGDDLGREPHAEVDAQTVVEVAPGALGERLVAVQELDVVQDVLVRVLRDVVDAEAHVDEDLALNHDEPLAPLAEERTFGVQHLGQTRGLPLAPPVDGVEDREHVLDARGPLFDLGGQEQTGDGHAEGVEQPQGLAVVEALEHGLRRDHHHLRQPQQNAGLLDQLAAEEPVHPLHRALHCVL